MDSDAESWHSMEAADRAGPTSARVEAYELFNLLPQPDVDFLEAADVSNLSLSPTKGYGR
jgi:hypothetical protein